MSDAIAPAPYAIGTVPTPEKRPRGLGRVAMVLGVSVFVASIAAAVAMGIAAAPYAVVGPTSFNVNLMFDPNDPVETSLAVLAFVHVGIGTALGTWALVQGIVATATNRGRAFGVVAIVAAFLAPGISLAVYLGTALGLAS